MADEVMGNGNGWKSKAQAAATFINQVGIPSVIIISILIYLGGMAIGKVDPPVVTKSQFKEFADRTTETHRTMIEESKSNTLSNQANARAIDKSTTVLEKINCELKPTSNDKLKCFRELNQGGE